MRYLRSLLLVTVVVAACGEPPTTGLGTDEAEAAGVLALPDVRSGSERQEEFQRAWNAVRWNVRLANPQYRVFADSAMFARFWAHAGADHTPAPPIPRVDFGSETVLMAAYGTSGGGDAIEIRRVARREDEIIVVVVRVHPGRGCAWLTMMTSPAAAVVVPGRADHVRFIVLERVRDCS